MATEGQRRRRRRQRQRRAAANQQRQSQRPPAPLNRGGGTRRRARGGGRQNLYLESLCSPAASNWVPRVPLQDAFPSSTIRLQWEFSLSSDANGRIGVCWGPGVTQAMFFLDSVANTWTNQPWPSLAGIQGAYDRFRPVSACMELEPCMTSMTDSGLLAAFLGMRGYNAGTTFANTSGRSNSITAIAKKGLMVCWRPQDNDDLIFIGTNANEIGAGLPPAFQSHAGITIQGIGLPVSTACFLVRWTVNLEVVATSDSMNPVGTDPQPVGAPPSSWLGDALGKLQELPIGGTLGKVGGHLMNAAIGYGMNRVRSYAGRNQPVPGLIDYDLD